MPSSLKTEDVSVILNTSYPFENKFEYTVDAKKDMHLRVRIPSFAKNIVVNKKATAFCNELDFEIPAGQKTNIEIEFDTVPTMILRPHTLRSVRYGSLVFSLPIAYEKKMYEYVLDLVERKYPYCDYEYIPKSDWNYAYASPFFTVERRGVSDVPFSSENPPIVLKAMVKKISWGFEPGYDVVCAKVPQSTVPLGEAETVDLYPYGCAKLRMTELPLV